MGHASVNKTLNFLERLFLETNFIIFLETLMNLITLQSALESWQEARIVQIDFSAAFARVNHLGILYKLCSEGVGGSFLSILTQFLSNRSHHVMVNGCRSKLIYIISGVLGPLMFLLCTSELFPFWKIS